MPTAARLVSAVYFAVLAFFAGSLVIPYFPEGTQVGLFGPGMAVIGALVGWTFMGPRSNDTQRATLGAGLTSSALIVFWGLVVFSGEEMYDRSINLRYEGVMKALTDMVALMIENFVMMAKPDVLIALIVGGLIGGWLARRTALVWP